MPAGSSHLSVTRAQLEAHLRLVQDLDLPHELFALISDARRLDAYGEAVARALETRSEARVVCQGPGALLWSMVAAQQGATVAIAESGTYLAALIRDVVSDNGFAQRITVTQGGPRELPAGWRHSTDLVVLDDIDSSLLGRGLLASARWARDELLAPGGALIPRAARLYTAPGELQLGPQCGFDLSPMDDYRGVAPNESVSLVAQGWRQLAEARGTACFDFARGVETLEERVEFRVERQGRFNMLASWYALELDEEASLDNAPVADDPKRRQAVSMLEEPVAVGQGDRLAFGTSLSGATGISFAAQGPYRLRDYGRLRPTLPSWHFPMLANKARNEAFVGAIERALAQRSGARVLDIGAGSGLLALAAARAGAGHVTACEMVPHIAELARRDVVRNGAEGSVEIVACPSFELRVPEHMEKRASLLVSETVDHGLLGERFLVALAHAREALLTPDATIIPSAATLYVTPIDLHTGPVRGFELRALDQLRLGHYTGMQLADTPHLALAEPHAVYHFDFQSGAAEPAQTRFALPITRAGVCSGVALSFDLMLDSEATISTAPGAGLTAWDQGIVFFEQTIDVDAGDTLPIYCDHDLERVSVYPDPEFLEQMPHRLWPRRRASWAMALRAEATARPSASATLARAMHAAEPAHLERLWQKLMADDSQLSWLRRDLLADLYAQLGHEL